MRLSAGVVAAGIALASVTPAAVAEQAAEPCGKEVLSLPAGALQGSLRATDPTGRYQVGEYQGADEEWKFALWRDGVPAELGLTGNTHPTDVNARGDVIGNTSQTGSWHGWRWRAGQVTPLPAPSGTAGAGAKAINSRGEIAGESFNGESWDQRIVVWSATNAVRTLPRPDGFNEAHVSGIDDDGTVVGRVLKMDYEHATVLAQRAVVWFPEGTWRFLPGTTADSVTDTKAIRHGQVVGIQEPNVTLLWSARSGGATELQDGVGPGDINTSGSVIVSNEHHRTLYQQGVGFRLLPENDTVMHSGTASGVTDDEQVYGSDEYDGKRKPVRWNCG